MNVRRGKGEPVYRKGGKRRVTCVVSTKVTRARGPTQSVTLKIEKSRTGMRKRTEGF